MSTATIPFETRFTIDEAQDAADDWGFNCGPGALCAVTRMKPGEIRPHLGDFEAKGYTNPTLMAEILHGLHIPFLRKYECAVKVDNREPAYPTFGLVRVQWGGPWTRPGVPMRARYRHTHWVAMRMIAATTWRAGSRPMPTTPRWSDREVFDINAMCVGGWLSWNEWSRELVPWLIKECQPKADGTWWPTHCWEIQR